MVNLIGLLLSIYLLQIVIFVLLQCYDVHVSN